MELEARDVEHIAALARIHLTDEEKETFRRQLSQILELFGALRQVDTNGIEPTAHAIELEGVLRQDIAGSSLGTQEVLENAPRREDNLFRVKAVLEE